MRALRIDFTIAFLLTFALALFACTDQGTVSGTSPVSADQLDRIEVDPGEDIDDNNQPEADAGDDVGPEEDAEDEPVDDVQEDTEDAQVEDDVADEPPEVEDVPEEVVEERFLRILGVEPDRGPITGGTEIFVHVDGELDSPVLLIGGRQALEVSVLGPETLFAITPQGAAGTADVKILDGDLEDTLVDGFLYFKPLAITSVSPQRSSTEGGELFEVHGEAFEESVQVSVGGRAAIDTQVLDETTLVAFTPPGVAGLADVRVTSQYSSAVARGAMEYFDRTEVEQILPAYGPSMGGNTIALLGRGLSADSDVRIGGLLADVTPVSLTRLEVTVPPGTPGPANVEVFNDNGSAGLPGGYLYIDGDQEGVHVLNVQPPLGPSSGGQEVVISGYGFNADELVVEFDGAPAGLIEISDAALRVRTPAGTVGPADVTVRHVNGSATLEDGYVYERAVEIHAVSPNDGPTEGGTQVVVDGLGFTENTEFRVGPLRALNVEFISETQVRLVTPPGSLGWASVTAVQGRLRGAMANGFRYTSRLWVSSFSPPRGSIAGGTFLTVRGVGFQQGSIVRVGDQPCIDTEIVDQATAICYTPPNREGAVPIEVQNSVDNVSATSDFIYFHPTSRFGGAWGDEVEGAVNVSVYNVQGEAVEDAFVMLTVDGDTEYQGYTNADGHITFSGPDVLGEQFVSATAAEHSSASVQAVDAENITILLFPLVPPMGGGGGGALPLATITGQVSGFQKIGDPGPNERQLIQVYTTQESPWRANPWPGNGNRVDPQGDRTYTLQSRIGDVAVIAVGGLINELTGTFTPFAYGIARHLFLSQDQVYEVDIELEHDLDQEMAFKLTGVSLVDPEDSTAFGPTINRVTPWLDLGFEGVFNKFGIAEGTGDTIVAEHMARLEGPIEDASYFVHGGSFRDRSTPYSVAVIHNLTELDGLIEMPELIGTPQPLIPLDGGIVDDRYIAFQPLTDNLPDFWVIQMYQLPATQVWEITIPGNQTWFHLPNFPEFGDVPAETRPNPYGFAGPLSMRITGARITGFDFDQHEYLNDLRSRDRWDSWTRATWTVQIRR